jgi:hypothetical protein
MGQERNGLLVVYHACKIGRIMGDPAIKLIYAAGIIYLIPENTARLVVSDLLTLYNQGVVIVTEYDIWGTIANKRREYEKPFDAADYPELFADDEAREIFESMRQKR